MLNGGARVRAVRVPTPDDAIIIYDSDDSRPNKGKGKGQAGSSDYQDNGVSKKGRRKAQGATADDKIIDLTL